ncbi:multidrug effflux MFS transporter [Gynuella sunshinyii]|uniref:Arabinose efflux permease n=1 Tax=Gynuella sunshinyii YC6258 TaxID=1445510 RepID=A0A0C5VSK7_9GAMM|nr:multidrug effflux MFS transporter [Gynuella sunshinyii]AJQ97672.1 hypothetical Protein YC6258_05644 [Gynuella sunshinyii YC6258]
MLWFAATFCAVSSVVLIGAVLWPENSLPLLIVGLLGYISCTGIIGSNCIARLMAIYPSNAGAAAGLAVALQFGLGAMVSVLTGVLYDGTPHYLAWGVGSCGLAGFAALWLTRLSGSSCGADKC